MCPRQIRGARRPPGLPSRPPRCVGADTRLAAGRGAWPRRQHPGRRPSLDVQPRPVASAAGGTHELERASTPRLPRTRRAGRLISAGGAAYLERAVPGAAAKEGQRESTPVPPAGACPRGPGPPPAMATPTSVVSTLRKDHRIAVRLVEAKQLPDDCQDSYCVLRANSSSNEQVGGRRGGGSASGPSRNSRMGVWRLTGVHAAGAGQVADGLADTEPAMGGGLRV